jgi:hypothetical protein
LVLIINIAAMEVSLLERPRGELEHFEIKRVADWLAVYRPE